ncbi:TetR/AcrR family transcriptional regulator [Psychromonas sp.]|uniref:TetR/AcrR family transcriptional regulator n=1 Tax=Psychromonas sp. TaxID=1884585 RepID=UPI0035698605
MSKHARFNRDEVVEKATNLYWEKGFHGTSMRNLQDVVDMRPGSIYATFGSKENLFKEALQHYAGAFEVQFNKCLEQQPSILGALKLFVESAVVDETGTAPSAMCMMVKTIAELTEEQAELLAETKQLLSGVESEFVKVIREAIVRGELDESKDPEMLARYLQVQIIGLRTYARANNNHQAVLALVDDIFATGPLAGAVAQD